MVDVPRNKQPNVENVDFLFVPSTTMLDVVLDEEDFLALDVPPKKKLLDFLHESETWMIAGSRGVGKTWMAMSLVKGITTGTGFGPWKCHNIVPCMYFDAEMPITTVQKRIREIGPVINNNLSIYCDSNAHKLGFPKAFAYDPKWRAGIKEVLLHKEVKLWVLDNLSSISGSADESSAADWGDINDWLLDIRNCGITTILIHHLGKNKTQRGTSRREDNLDGSIILTPTPGHTADQGARFVLTFTKTRLDEEDLKFAQTYEFRLAKGEDGRPLWIYELAKDSNRKRIETMLENLSSPKEISEALQVDLSYVYRIKKQMFPKAKR